MCRILGISMGDTPEDLDNGEICAILFPALVQQGPHAYGWMTYNPEEDGIDWAKFPGRCDTKEAWVNILENVDPKAKWVVGHTRFATHGDPSDIRNDHPIPHRNVIGVHNGVLTNHEEILKQTGREDPKTRVDSEAIFAAVNKWGHKKGLAKIKGAMVAVYSDFRYPHILKIARSTGRQLTLGFTDRGNMIFASDKSALLRLQPEIKFIRFSTILDNRLLTIKNGKIVERKYFVQPPPRLQLPRPSSYARLSSGSWFVHTDEQAKEIAQEMKSRFEQAQEAAIAQHLSEMNTQRRIRERREQKDRLFPNGMPTKKKD